MAMTGAARASPRPGQDSLPQPIIQHARLGPESSDKAASSHASRCRRPSGSKLDDDVMLTGAAVSSSGGQLSQGLDDETLADPEGVVVVGGVASRRTVQVVMVRARPVRNSGCRAVASPARPAPARPGHPRRIDTHPPLPAFSTLGPVRRLISSDDGPTASEARWTVRQVLKKHSLGSGQQVHQYLVAAMWLRPQRGTTAKARAPGRSNDDGDGTIPRRCCSPAR